MSHVKVTCHCDVIIELNSHEYNKSHSHYSFISTCVTWCQVWMVRHFVLFFV